MIEVKNVREMVKVKSNTVEKVQSEAESLKQKGYSPMAIMYFLGQKYPVSLTFEDGEYVIRIP